MLSRARRHAALSPLFCCSAALLLAVLVTALASQAPPGAPGSQSQAILTCLTSFSGRQCCRPTRGTPCRASLLLCYLAAETRSQVPVARAVRVLYFPRGVRAALLALQTLLQ